MNLPHTLELTVKFNANFKGDGTIPFLSSSFLGARTTVSVDLASSHVCPFSSFVGTAMFSVLFVSFISEGALHLPVRHILTYRVFGPPEKDAKEGQKRTPRRRQRGLRTQPPVEDDDPCMEFDCDPKKGID